MQNEKMRVLDLLENGKINAEEAANLLEVLGAKSNFMSKENREQAEEKFHQFAKDVKEFAKEAGCKIQDFYKDVEPKVKKVSQHALEKAAAALDNLACSINESLERQECCGKEENCACGDEKPKADDDNTPIPN